MNTILKEDWYTAPDLTKKQAAYRADFEDCVYKLAMLNGLNYAAYG